LKLGRVILRLEKARNVPKKADLEWSLMSLSRKESKYSKAEGVIRANNGDASEKH
jgi:hypothetical protein